MWHEQAEIECARRVISIVACCRSVKLCELATRAFQSQQSGAAEMITFRLSGGYPAG